MKHLIYLDHDEGSCNQKGTYSLLYVSPWLLVRRNTDGLHFHIIFIFTEWLGAQGMKKEQIYGDWGGERCYHFDVISLCVLSPVFLKYMLDLRG